MPCTVPFCSTVLLHPQLPRRRTARRLIQTANLMVLIHMFPAYQVFSQPVFMEAEQWIEQQPWTSRGRWITFRIAFRWDFMLLLRAAQLTPERGHHASMQDTAGTGRARLHTHARTTHTVCV